MAFPVFDNWVDGGILTHNERVCRKGRAPVHCPYRLVLKIVTGEPFASAVNGQVSGRPAPVECASWPGLYSCILCIPTCALLASGSLWQYNQ